MFALVVVQEVCLFSGDAFEMQPGKPLDKLNLVSYDRGGYICSRGLKKKMVEPAPENVRQVCKERVFCKKNHVNIIYGRTSLFGCL